MFWWFENRIDPFAPKAIERPPNSLLRFYWFFVRPVWPAFAAIVVLDLFAALSEVALATFVARLIDLMKSTTTPATFLRDHIGLLCWMGAVVLIVRPVIFFSYDLAKNQVLSPQFQTRVRWQTHRYLLRQSLGFFQGDFAGRVANKWMQTAPALRDSMLLLSDAAVFVGNVRGALR